MPDLDRVEFLFHESLLIPPEADRLTWLAAQCAGDSSLFQEVSTLLEARAHMAEFAPAAELPPPPSARFGAYRAVSLLGRGGMSAVYLAERADGQFEQTVALKVMAGYLADGDFFRRFEAERQFLAVLNHHNITRFLDGGVSSSGDPFLVTEYVNGDTIDRYCEERKLTIALRLTLFLQVCEAVDYAHRNLIVHRDLKPANILVNQEGIVKLLDFGTAALTETAQKDRTITRMRMVTPRYASPEQLRGQRVNISTDVFSLGVVLYELLTGAWPFGDPKSTLRQIDRSSTDVSANPPSSAITEEAAETRCISREQLTRTVKGDLSAILLKALESEPSRRYESVRALAVDLESVLAGRPVSARPQTTTYRAGKFLRRRWLPVSAAAVFVIAISTAALVATYQARLARERYADMRSLTTSLLFELKDAISDVPGATKAQQILVNRVVKNLDKLSQSSDDPDLQLELAEAFRQLGELQGDPYVQNLNDTKGAFVSLAKARSIADNAAKSRPKDDPGWLRLAGMIDQVEGDVYFGMGQGREAVAHLTTACSYFDKIVPRITNPAWLAEAATVHGSLGDMLGQPGTSSVHDLARAAAEYHRTIVLDELTLKIAPGYIRSRRGIPFMRMKLGDLVRQGDPVAALDDFNQALREFDALPAEELKKPTTRRLGWYMLRKKGVCLGDLDQWSEAETIMLQVIAFSRADAAQDPNDSRATNNLLVAMDDYAEQLFRHGDNAKADAYVEQIIPLLEALLRTDPGNLSWRENLAHQRCLHGTLLARLGHPGQALPVSKAGLDEMLKLSADKNASPLVLSAASEDLRAVEPAELRDPSRSVQLAQRNVMGQEHEPFALYLLAMAYQRAGKVDEARDAAAKALALIAPPRGALESYMRRELEQIR